MQRPPFTYATSPFHTSPFHSGFEFALTLLAASAALVPLGAGEASLEAVLGRRAA
jgi:hypothetical protein